MLLSFQLFWCGTLYFCSQNLSISLSWFIIRTSLIWHMYLYFVFFISVSNSYSGGGLCSCWTWAGGGKEHRHIGVLRCEGVGHYGGRQAATFFPPVEECAYQGHLHFPYHPGWGICCTKAVQGCPSNHPGWHQEDISLMGILCSFQYIYIMYYYDGF